MTLFIWIVLGLSALLLVLSGLCRLLDLLLDDRRWRKLSLKLFRFSLVGVLVCINGVIWVSFVSDLL